MTISGILGNFISILVLRRKVMRTQYLNSFLLVQAVIDLGVVLTLLLRKWLEYALRFDISDTNDFMCKFLHFLSSGLVDISSWNLVLTSLEKLMFVIHPITSRVNRSESYRRMKMTIVFFIIVLYNMPSLIGYGIGHISTTLNNNRTESNDECCYNSNADDDGNNTRNNKDVKNYKDNSHIFLHRESGHIDSVSSVTIIVGTLPVTASKIAGKCTHVFEFYTQFVDRYDNWIHTFIRIVVPAMIMMICNIIIIRTISRRPLLEEPQSTNPKNKKRGSAVRRRIPPNTKLVVVVNLLFFVTCAPVSINRIYDCLNNGYNTSPSFSYLRLLALTHHSVGFAFYMLSGQRFREEFFSMCREVYAFCTSCCARPKKAFPSISLELSKVWKENYLI